MAQYSFGQGDVRIVMDDGLAQMVERVLREVAPGVGELLEDTARELYDQAYARWPVGADRNRPHSRELLSWEMQIGVGADTIRARVFCTAEYGKYIKPKGMGGKTAFVEFLRKPKDKAAKKLAAALTQEMKDLIEG